MTSKIEQLKTYALANYDNGGDWIVETYSDNDYSNVLDKCLRNVDLAKKQLRAQWELTESVARDIQGYSDEF
jgi:hypothetical protein